MESENKEKSTITAGAKMSNLETELALQGKDIDYIKKKLDHIDEKLDKHYVTKEEFLPIRNIVYGMVGLILISVTTALLALVISGRH